MEDGRQSTGWKKSTRSESANCVEIWQLPDKILVRDSKNPEGEILTFSLPAWGAFLADVKGGKYDL